MYPAYEIVQRFYDWFFQRDNIAYWIVMCIAFFWKLDRDQKQHKEEMDKMTDALHNNTLAIQHLADIVNRQEV